MSSRASAVYRGWVRHRRHGPISHEFRYRLALLYLDLDELDDVFADSWLYSVGGRTPVSFHRRDYLFDPGVPLALEARELVSARLGRDPGGPVRLLTHPRYFGYVMNPVSFYYCFAPGGGRLDAIVAELRNTPWGERHCYVLDAAAARRRASPGRRLEFRFDKEFHVSPFMPMDLAYRWRLTEPGRRLVVHMDNLDGGARSFDATMVLRRGELDARSLRGVFVSHPLMTFQVVAGIYWQALRLWLMRAPVHAHPDPRSRKGLRDVLAPRR